MKYLATFLEKRRIDGHYYNEYSEITVEADDQSEALAKLRYRSYVNETLMSLKEIKEDIKKKR